RITPSWLFAASFTPSGGGRLFRADATPREQFAQIANGGKNLIIPVVALRVMRCLLALDDVFVFPKNVVREPGYERPGQVQKSRQAGLFHREIAEGSVGALLPVPWRIGQPNVQYRITAARRPEFEPLIRIFRADGHQIP